MSYMARISDASKTPLHVQKAIYRFTEEEDLTIPVHEKIAILQKMIPYLQEPQYTPTHSDKFNNITMKIMPYAICDKFQQDKRTFNGLIYPIALPDSFQSISLGLGIYYVKRGEYIVQSGYAIQDDDEGAIERNFSFQIENVTDESLEDSLFEAFKFLMEDLLSTQVD